MKAKSKIILSSVLGIALAGGVLAGTTYALFTSEAKNDIQVESGKVKVNLTIDSLTAYTPKGIDPTTGVITDATDIANNTGAVKKFGLGGEAKVEGNTVTLSKMVPGDKVTIQYSVANESNVTIKQRDSFDAVDNGLLDALNISLDGQPAYPGKTSWQTKEAADVVSHTVVIEMEGDAGEEYQEASCTFTFESEGVQANAAVKDVFGVKHADGSETGYASLDQAFESVQSGETVVLNESAYLFEPVNVTFPSTTTDVKFDGNQNNLFVSLDDDTHAMYFTEGNNGTKISVKDVNVYGDARGCFYFKGNGDHELENVNIDGQFKLAAVYFRDCCGGTIKDSTIFNRIDGEETVYAQYGMPFALDIFANRDSAHPLILDNVETGLVNINSSTATYTTPKCQVLAGSHVEKLLSDTPETDVYASYEAGTVDHFYYDQGGIYHDIIADDYTIVCADGLVKLSSLVNNDGNKFTGKTVKVGLDIDMSNISNFDSIGFDYSHSFGGTFEGNNKTIKNLKVSKTGENATAGLFGSLHAGGQIQNVIIDGADIQSEHYAGGIVGWLEGGAVKPNITNCKVINSNIVSKAHYTGTEWNDGDKVGGIVGYVWGANITDCIVSGCLIQGYRDIGGVVGILNSSGASVTGCNVENCSLVSDRTHDYKHYQTEPQYNVNEIVGRYESGTLSGNTFSDVTKHVISE